jgi:hypothetical protein
MHSQVVVPQALSWLSLFFGRFLTLLTLRIVALPNRLAQSSRLDRFPQISGETTDGAHVNPGPEADVLAWALVLPAGWSLELAEK